MKEPAALSLDKYYHIIKRGNYSFITWKGDHDPRHVHVFENGKEVLKWNLDNHVAIKGKITKKIRKLIEELIKEGKL